MQKNKPLTFEVYRNAMGLPCDGTTFKGPVSGGLVDSAGEEIPNGILRRNNSSVKVLPNGKFQRPGPPQFRRLITPDPIAITHPPSVLKGRYIYGGLLFKHFGHFLLESLATLWCIKRHPGLCILWISTPEQTNLSRVQKEILDTLDVTNPVCILTQPSVIEELIVPQPGYRITSDFHAEQRHALQVLPASPPRPGKKIWLSRQNFSSGNFLNEPLLERILKKRGWLIYRPDLHGFRNQLDMLHDAEHIAGIGGSAFHLLLFFSTHQARITMFTREKLVISDFISIAETLNLNQTICFAPSINCNPQEQPWLTTGFWPNLNLLLAQLGEPAKNLAFLYNLHAVRNLPTARRRLSALQQILLHHLSRKKKKVPLIQTKLDGNSSEYISFFKKPFRWNSLLKFRRSPVLRVLYFPIKKIRNRRKAG